MPLYARLCFSTMSTNFNSMTMWSKPIAELGLKENMIEREEAVIFSAL